MRRRIGLFFSKMNKMRRRIGLNFPKLNSMRHRIGLYFSKMNKMRHRIGLNFSKLNSMRHRIGLFFSKMNSMRCRIGLDFSKINLMRCRIGLLFLEINTFLPVRAFISIENNPSWPHNPLRERSAGLSEFYAFPRNRREWASSAGACDILIPEGLGENSLLGGLLFVDNSYFCGNFAMWRLQI
jgi:hypothetical protein